MTTIDSVPGFTIAQRNAGAEKPMTGSGFADHFDLHAQRDRLDELTAELNDLQQKQLRMSNTQYLLARFALQEQISAERLKAGEDLDTIRVSIDGQGFEIAGRALKVDLLEHKKLPPEDMVQVSRPRDR